MILEVPVLDHGFVRLRNVAGPTRRPDRPFDADDIDPANTARMSFDQMDSGRTREDDLRLVNYLMRELHTTPIEMIVVWLEMKMPIYVARQIVRHRTASINEVSGRYVKLPAEWYIPELDWITTKAESNKQGRSEIMHPDAETFAAYLEDDCRRSYARYEWAVREKFPNELARSFLHLNHYTHWIWKQDLHNLMHLLSLRQHKHAQRESRAYADGIYDLMTGVLPDLMGLYDRYRRRG